MESVPKTLDWVKARAECSIEHVFMLLVEVVDSDVKAVQARTDRRGEFGTNRLRDTKLIVTKASDYGAGLKTVAGVVFERTPSGIDVHASTQDGQKTMFTA